MKKYYLTASMFISLCTASVVSAQTVTEVTGKRLYEHHSAAAQQSCFTCQSGYDFVNHANIFIVGTSNTPNRDMIEDVNTNNNNSFGFTSGVNNYNMSGNGTTEWMLAPSGFNYATLTDVGTLAALYNSSTAGTGTYTVQNNEVYIGKIRNTNQYVVMRCYNVTNNPINSGSNSYFDFDYKYGVVGAAGIAEVTPSRIAVYPNPAVSDLTIEHLDATALETAILYATDGQMIHSFSLTAVKETLDISFLNSGIYFLSITSENGLPVTFRLVK